jgi:enoyl-CoA hydratase/carnithine racemase
MELSARRQGETVWRLTLAGEGGALLDGPGVEALLRALTRVAGDGDCRALVLDGGEGSFCGGMDLAHVMGQPRDQVSRHLIQYVECLALLRRLPAVVIAAVDGAAAGGGLGLAAAADLAFASARASFALPELALGLWPVMVLPVLLERVPPQRVLRLALAGEVGAEEAAGLGLVDRVLADAEALRRAVERQLRRVHRLRPEAVGGLKRQLSRLAGLPVAVALEQAGPAAAQMLSEADLRRALAAYLEGAPLPWFSRAGRSE